MDLIASTVPEVVASTAPQVTAATINFNAVNTSAVDHSKTAHSHKRFPQDGEDGPEAKKPRLDPRILHHEPPADGQVLFSNELCAVYDSLRELNQGLEPSPGVTPEENTSMDIDEDADDSAMGTTGANPEFHRSSTKGYANPNPIWLRPSDDRWSGSGEEDRDNDYSGKEDMDVEGEEDDDHFGKIMDVEGEDDDYFEKIEVEGEEDEDNGRQVGSNPQGAETAF
jgi:hypothetical protein